MRSATVCRRWQAFGLALALLALSSCGGGGSSSNSPPPTPGSKVFFTDGGNRAIVSFSNATPTGNFPIDRVVFGSHTGLGTTVGDILSIPSIVLDAANDRLYVATQGNTFIYNTISTANGDVTPTITMSATINTGSGNRGVNFMHNDLNRGNGTLYSVDFSGEVHVFNNPIAAPSTVSRLINPDLGATTILSTFGLAIDSTTNDMLYVGAVFSGTGSSNIIVFNNASTIGTAPTTITPKAPDRTLSFANAVGSFYLDTANDKLYVSQSNGVVLVFDGASTLPSGTNTPNRTIDTGTGVQSYIFVDTSTRNKLYAVASNTAGQVGAFIYVDNASTATYPIPTTARHSFLFTMVPNIALSAIAVAP
jgi:hypothetical protein